MKKKIWFFVFFLLLMISISLGAFFGAGTLSLYQKNLLWADDASCQKYLEFMEFQSGRLWELGVKAGIQMDRYYLLLDDEADEENFAHQLAQYLLQIVREQDWEAADAFCEQYQIQYKIYHSQGRPLGGNMTTADEKDAYRFSLRYINSSTGSKDGPNYIIYLKVDMGGIQMIQTENYWLQVFWISHRYAVVLITIFAGILALVLFVVELCLAWRTEWKLGNFDKIPLDALLALSAYGCYYFIFQKDYLSLYQGQFSTLIVRWFYAIVVALLLIFYVVHRLHGKAWYRENVLYGVFQFLWKTAHTWCEVFQNLSLVWNLVLLEIGLTVLECGLMLWLIPFEKALFQLLAYLGILKFLVIPWLMRYGIAIGRIQKVTSGLAAGDMEQHVDTKELPRALQKLGEDVNSMGDSVSLAVEQRLKSERLKTELITNVSHDIKTPLTSIINFSDLIVNEETENEKIKDYASHLHQQSSRLKKLIEDLMEASKASTGNLEVHLAPCDARVLLGQCLGEYEERLREKGLELVVKQSEEPLRIMADSRMLWRVFDNLVNNICKYAQKDTRVYLSAERSGELARIYFKNVSKYALDIAPEELLERFVRGDLSRHAEGNGLGLSIVSSLMELQGGTIHLDVDADLFKVMLEFPLAKEMSAIREEAVLKEKVGNQEKTGKEEKTRIQEKNNSSEKEEGKNKRKLIGKKRKQKNQKEDLSIEENLLSENRNRE
ncbi:MAG: HAMP domain-containing histidine kinase [Lachnospiraceae bacterium]|nr:HAMP domain-containing histidine kinase [Lachnospiraceae bacterium]